MKRVSVNIFEEIWGQLLLSSVFDKRRITPDSVFLPGFKVQHCLYCWKLSSCHYFFYFSRPRIRLINEAETTRAHSTSLLRPIMARNHLTLFKIFNKFCTFSRKFWNILPFFLFFNIFCSFLKNRIHALTFWSRPWLNISLEKCWRCSQYNMSGILEDNSSQW